MRYRKRPVEIEAVLLDHASLAQAERWCNGRIVHAPTGKVTGIEIPTLEGVMTANLGDYIIQGVEGEFYPCKPEIFRKTYEPA